MRKLLLLLALLSIPVPVWAQANTVVRGVDFSTLASTDVGDSPNHAFRVTIQNGITFASPQAVTQSGTWTVTGAGGTFPVTGTFWQATQPVSGTFWQATQPVSGTVTANAGTGTFAVSGTFWQVTQPVSGTVTANAGTGTMAVSGPLTDTQLRATPVPVSGTVTANAGTGTLAVSGPVTDAQLRATPVPVSGTVTVTDGSGALNVIVDSGTTVVTQGTAANLNATVVGTGTFATQLTGATNNINNVSGTVSLPTGASTLAEQQSQTTSLQTLDNIVSGAGANVSQFGGTNVVTGFGPAAAGVPRVTASSDDLVGNVTVNVASGTTPCPAANASAVTSSASCIQIPIAGFTGVAAEIQAGTLVGTVVYEYSSDGGTTWNAALASAGSIQTVAGTVFGSANTLTAVNFLVGNTTSHVRVRVNAFTSGAAVVYVRASKMIGALAVGAITAAIPGLQLPLLGNQTAIRGVTATPAAVTTNTTAFLTGDVYGAIFARVDHPARIKCNITTTSTTSVIVTGCSAPSAGLSIYVTDISIYGGVANAITAASTIQTGTGGTCGTATTVIYYCQHGATAGCEAHFLIPMKTTTIHEVCILDAAVGTKFATISGYVAP